MNRSAQLDSLRAIAVSLVVLHHWTNWGRTISQGLGNIGVQLFFVLSGFLITRILLGMRHRLDLHEAPLVKLLTSFHISRSTRIWPIAFITLIMVFFAGSRFAQRSDLPWHFMFASNWLFFFRGSFDSSLSHFWSLAVEQQFYLVWPFVVLLATSAYLERIILALIILAPISRLALYEAGFTNFAQYNVLPFASFDSLGMGALVAFWSGRGLTQTTNKRFLLLKWAAGAACPAIVALAFVEGFGYRVPANLEQTLFAVAFAWLIAAAEKGIGGSVGSMLNWRPLAWLGVISYGVYVYHVFAPRVMGAVLRTVQAPELMQGGIPLLIESALLTLCVASGSWYLIEQPLLRVRKSLQPEPSARPRQPKCATQSS